MLPFSDVRREDAQHGTALFETQQQMARAAAPTRKTRTTPSYKYEDADTLKRVV